MHKISEGMHPAYKKLALVLPLVYRHKLPKISMGPCMQGDKHACQPRIEWPQRLRWDAESTQAVAKDLGTDATGMRDQP